MLAFMPFFNLAVEANEVVRLRLLKITLGKSGALDEVDLMITEKVDAAVEAGTSLFLGRSPLEVVERYREHVANNLRRLSA